jgi:hypothetical protein
MFGVCMSSARKLTSLNPRKQRKYVIEPSQTKKARHWTPANKESTSLNSRKQRKYVIEPSQTKLTSINPRKQRKHLIEPSQTKTVRYYNLAKIYVIVTYIDVQYYYIKECKQNVI